MSMTKPMTLWSSLSFERRRHIQMAVIGIAISWSLAALMALRHT